MHTDKMKSFSYEQYIKSTSLGNILFYNYIVFYNLISLTKSTTGISGYSNSAFILLTNSSIVTGFLI
jgi:hypothetical protein